MPVAAFNEVFPILQIGLEFFIFAWEFRPKIPVWTYLGVHFINRVAFKMAPEIPPFTKGRGTISPLWLNGGRGIFLKRAPSNLCLKIRYRTFEIDYLAAGKRRRDRRVKYPIAGANEAAKG